MLDWAKEQPTRFCLVGRGSLILCGLGPLAVMD
jgi:hypothetical protein